MRCPSCRVENLSDAKFCSECGAKLEPPCPSCGTPNLAAAKFCRNCGTQLNGAPASQPPRGFTSPAPATKSPGANRERARPARAARGEAEGSVGDVHVADQVRVQPASDSPTEGERKTVTALFADIKGSTELEQDLDPEEARAIVDPALKLML